MLELVMKTDLREATPSAIDFNFEELKTELAERLEHYNGLVVTEDGIKEAKADRAKLNKLRTAIDTRRKDIKKEYLKPYNEFEGKIKELTLLIDQPIMAIDTQLADYEERRKEAKLERVKAAYLKNIPENLESIIPFERILDQKWLNATTTMKTVEDDLLDWTRRVNADLFVIDTVEPEYQAAVKQKYIESLDIASAMRHRDSLKAAEEAFRAREAEKKAREEELTALEAKRAAETISEPQTVQLKIETEEMREIPMATPAPEEKRYTLRLEIYVTRAQAIALREFIDQNQITYRKL